jgi:hypothetical protein
MFVSDGTGTQSIGEGIWKSSLCILLLHQISTSLLACIGLSSPVVHQPFFRHTTSPLLMQATHFAF